MNDHALPSAISSPSGVTAIVQRGRAAFTAIELAVVLSIVLILVSTGTIATLPMLRRSAFTQSLGKLEDVAAQARMLARRSADLTNFYGVVVRRNGAVTEAAITFGTSATWTKRVIGAGGAELALVDLGPAVVIYGGNSHAGATAMAAGAEFGWMYRSVSGRVASSSVATLVPAFIGVTSAELTSAGIIDSAVLVDQALSLRSQDQRQVAAIAVYANGAMSTCPLSGL
ncbi:MAG: hypothetical protein H0W72_01595 [Planctomycetes bacterium]|nr:hypothetical protein [Planctomycetota bacterium]